MGKLIIAVGASKDSFGAYSVNCEGIYAGGITIEECKNNVYEAIDLIKKNIAEDQWPDEIKDNIEIEWQYDAVSLLQYYGTIISLAGLQRITGIHQKQLWSYMHGKSKPRARQLERIQNTLRSFGRELSSMAII